jgi:transposase
LSKSQDSDALCGYRLLKVDHSTRFNQGRVYINGLEGFWSYAKGRLMEYHGISPKHSPFYIKKLEFRDNHRKEDLFPLMVNLITKFSPNLE